MDLQQRGIEFSQLFRNHSNLRSALLEKMPPMVITRVSQQNSDGGTPEDGDGVELIENGVDDGGDVIKVTTGNDSNALLDLLGGTDGPMDPLPTQLKLNNFTTTNNATQNNQDLLDLLGGLDLGTPAGIPDPLATVIDDTNNGNNPLSFGFNNIMGGVGIGLVGGVLGGDVSVGGGLLEDLSLQNISSVTSTTNTLPKLIALDKNGLLVELAPTNSQGCLQVIMTATNNSLNSVEQFLFQVS